jgi:hypothetical protein
MQNGGIIKGISNNVGVLLVGHSPVNDLLLVDSEGLSVGFIWLKGQLRGSLMAG